MTWLLDYLHCLAVESIEETRLKIKSFLKLMTILSSCQAMIKYSECERRREETRNKDCITI